MLIRVYWQQLERYRFPMRKLEFATLYICVFRNKKNVKTEIPLVTQRYFTSERKVSGKVIGNNYFT